MEINIEEIRQIFFEDAQEHLEEMEAAIASLESDVSDDASAIASLFRSVHSLKGDSGAVGLDVIGESLHAFETELDCMRQGDRRMTGETVGAIRDVVDQIDILIDAVKSDRDAPEEFEAAIGRFKQATLQATEDVETDEGGATTADDFGLFDEPDEREASVANPEKEGTGSEVPPFFGDFLIDRELLSEDQVMQVLGQQRREQPFFGEVLVKAGRLSIGQGLRVLTHAEATGHRFGEVALDLGYISTEDIREGLSQQLKARPGFRKTAVKLGFIDRDRVEAAFEEFNVHCPEAKAEREAAGLQQASSPDQESQDSPAYAPQEFDSDPELLSEFVSESTEHLEIAEDQLLVIESETNNSEALNAIYRSFHTIKGVASFLGLEDTRHLAHQAESMFNLARDGKLELTGDAFEVALASVDGLKRQIRFAEKWLDTQHALEVDPELPNLLQAIDAVSNGVKVSRSALAAKASPAPSESSSSKREKPAPSPVHVKESIKVDRDRLDKLINVIGELVIGQAMVEEEVATWQAQTGNESMAMSQLNKTVRDLQELSLSLRMVPVGSAFHKMARIVRDLGRKLGKEINFDTEGDETELDKTVVDQIGDPLLHMVRNAADHGIEPPEDRIAAGKPKQGNVSLRAYHQGGNIYIEIQDDGKGLDRDALLKKAIERELVSESDNLTDQEIFNLIFAPGFSTAKNVTDVSGRGVGMDVVRRNVEALQGSVSVTSVKGKGSTVTIRLPLTLAILDGLSIRVGQEIYIIPILSVVESFSPQPADMKRIAGKGEVVMVRGEVVPLLRLSRLFGATQSSGNVNSLVVIVEDRSKKFALLVDELLGQSQVVIKNLETNYEKVEGIAGATILGDGRIAMIIDVFGLVALAAQNASTKVEAVPIFDSDAQSKSEENEDCLTGDFQS